VVLKAMLVEAPLQIVCDTGVATTLGNGFTVTITLNGVPVHPAEDGVIRYVAVPDVEPVVVKVCAMLLPNPAVAPLTPVWEIVQLYVGLATPLLVLNAIAVVAPLQIVCEDGVATTSGRGFTVMITVIGAPGQLAADGVIV
jgi:hypothetical protein